MNFLGICEFPIKFWAFGCTEAGVNVPHHKILELLALVSDKYFENLQTSTLQAGKPPVDRGHTQVHRCEEAPHRACCAVATCPAPLLRRGTHLLS